jgi:hypothetical protein
MRVEKQIVITVVEDIEREEIGLEVSVSEGFTTVEAVGYMEMAKLQHMQSKHIQGPTIHQTLGHEGSDRWTGGDKKDEV